MSAPRLEILAAVAANNVIGRNGQLPWHLPDDLKRFKSLTLNQTVIMGRKTYESIGKPLPNRRNIIISATLPTAPPNTERATSLEHALDLCTNTPQRTFIIGGAQLYAAALPKAQVLHLTELTDPVEGDTFFPPFDKSHWLLDQDESHPRDEHHAISFHFRTYLRRTFNQPSPPSPTS
jgi:dihydrofolate reductase